jgi:hypothetical protein
MPNSALLQASHQQRSCHRDYINIFKVQYDTLGGEQPSDFFPPILQIALILLCKPEGEFGYIIASAINTVDQ